MWQQEYNQAKRSPELNLKYSSYSMYVYILYTVMPTHTNNRNMNVIHSVYIVNSFESLLLLSGLVGEEMWTINQP